MAADRSGRLVPGSQDDTEHVIRGAAGAVARGLHARSWRDRVLGRGPRASRRIGGGGSIAAARTAVSRFSLLGIASVGTITATGLVNTWILAGSIPALIDTEYGHLLLLKVAFFLVMLLFAAINRLWLTPRMEGAPNAAVAADMLRRIERNSLIEAALGTIIIVIVGLLGTLPPGLQDPSID
jgi:putative copper resistance protein D